MIPVPVLDQERPGVVSDLIDAVSLLRIGVENAPDNVLALA